MPNRELLEGVLDATDEDGWMAKKQLYNPCKVQCTTTWYD